MILYKLAFPTITETKEAYSYMLAYGRFKK